MKIRVIGRASEEAVSTRVKLFIVNRWGGLGGIWSLPQLWGPHFFEPWGAFWDHFSSLWGSFLELWGVSLGSLGRLVFFFGAFAQ